MAAPFHEFAGNRRMLWIAQEWLRYSDRLAEWAMERVVNRRDVWSQYTLKNGEISVVMLPIPERRKAGTDMVTLDKLKRHFSGKSVAHLIGLHSISDHSTAKWFAIDVDLHDPNVLNADEIAEANFTAAFEWAGRLQADGFDPLLMDSNGAGGYHVWVLLDDEYPLADVFSYVSNARSDWADFGLQRKPEVFPPKGVVKPDDLPYTLRLAGRHHTRHHYTRIYNFDPAAELQWLEAGDAIEAMLATRPGKLTVTAADLPPVDASKPSKKAKPGRRRNRVCVDLDGVLAEYHGWPENGGIGAPLKGALDFMRELNEFSDIVIFSSRCSDDIVGDHDNISAATPGQRRIQIIDWLEKHHFPFADVYMGQGKPRVAAFIDDRGIACRPQDDDGAYGETIKNVKLMLKGKR